MTINGETGYSELYAELLRLIPVYSKKWTNYNNTDPGITILQSLTQLAVWQNNAIAEPNSEIAEKLLALLTLYAGNRTAAEVTVGIAGNIDMLPQGTQLQSGESCYELLASERIYDGRIVMLCTRTKQSEFKEISHLLYSGISTFVYPFGENPDSGMEFYIGIDKPLRDGEALKLYMDFIDTTNTRNPFEKDSKLVFAKLCWEYYTENGFVKANVTDDTFAFMHSASVTIPIEQDMAEFDIVGKSSFCIRVTLLGQQYDCPPKLCNIFCNPLVFKQKKTIAQHLLFSYSHIETNSYKICLSEASELMVLMLIRCTDGLWRRCNFHKEVNSENEITLEPIAGDNLKAAQGSDTVMTILYCPECADAIELGMLYGYDNQKIELPYSGVLTDDFETMLMLEGKDGEMIFADEQNTNYAYRYHFDPAGNAIVVESACFGEDNKLIVTGCTVTNGSRGNIRPGELKNAICPKEITIITNAQGSGGTDGLTMSDLKNKLLSMLRMPEVPVSEEDYERLTRQVPGLRIDRVRAYSDGDNIVKIAVAPISEKHFPRLGRVYQEAIENFFEERKLITTAIDVIEPIYLPIDVYLAVHIKSYATDAEAAIRKVLSRELDYYQSGCDFGSIVLYNRLYSRLEQVDCVEYIERMILEADSSYGQAVVDGNDIRLSKCALPYLRKAEIRQVLSL